MPPLIKEVFKEWNSPWIIFSLYLEAVYLNTLNSFIEILEVRGFQACLVSVAYSDDLISSFKQMKK